MKIHELSEEYNFTPQLRKVRRVPRVHEPRLAKDATKLGSGAYATTYTRSSTPHDVRKMSHSANDPTYHYLTAIGKSNDPTNPYFPRVRSLKKYTDKNKATVYSVQMERLRHLEDLGSEEIAMLLTKMVGEEKGNLPKPDMYSLVYAINRVYFNIEKNERVPKDTDPHLISACKLISKVRKKTESMYDVHMSNVMFRRTPSGPQLVITDPLA